MDAPTTVLLERAWSRRPRNRDAFRAGLANTTAARKGIEQSRVWLSKSEEEGYYYGLANQGLWPLCHVAHTRPRFDRREWEIYKEVNLKFAEAVLEEAGSEPALVFVQDYHFALLPKMLKERRPDLAIAHFWHIPWPNPEAFGICPWGDEVLDGLLGNDLLGFHIQQHCNNFLSTVERSMETVVDYERFAVQRQGHSTSIRPFPISVDDAAIASESQSAKVLARVDSLQRELGLRGQLVGVGIDRVDYTKGIPERLIEDRAACNATVLRRSV